MRAPLARFALALSVSLTACTSDDPVGTAVPEAPPAEQQPFSLVLSSDDAMPGDRVVVAVRGNLPSQTLLAAQGRIRVSGERLRFLGTLPQTGSVAIGNPTEDGSIAWLAVSPRGAGGTDVALLLFEVLGAGYASDLQLNTLFARGRDGGLPTGLSRVSDVDPTLRVTAAPVLITDLASVAEALGVDVPADITGPARVSEAWRIGDCTQDGPINLRDILTSALMALGIAPEPTDPVRFRICDADGSGVIDGTDVLEISLVSLGLAPTVPTVGQEAYFVDSEGGTYDAPDGAVSLSVPANALAELATIFVSSDSDVPPEPVLAATVRSLDPADLTFASPATLALTFDPAALPEETEESQLALFQFVDGAWVELESTVDSDAKIVSGDIDGLGIFAIGVGPSDPPVNVAVRFTDPEGGPIPPEVQELSSLQFRVVVENLTESVARDVEVTIDVDADATDLSGNLDLDGNIFSGTIPELAGGAVSIYDIALTTESVAAGPHITTASVATAADVVPEDDLAVLELEVVGEPDPVCGSGTFSGSVRSAEDLAALRQSGQEVFGGSIFLDGSTATAIDLPCVTEVGGFFDVRNNPNLTYIDMPRVEEFGRGATFADNPQLVTFSAPLLTRLPGAPGVALTGNEALTTIDLNSVDGPNDLIIAGASVTDLRLNGLTRGQLILGPLPALQSLDLPNLVNLEFNASTFRDLPSLTSLVLPNLVEANSITFRGRLPATISLPSLLYGDRIAVQQSSGVQRISAPLVDSLRLGFTAFDNDDLEEVDVPSLRVAIETVIQQNGKLQRVDLTSFTEGGLSFRYEANSTEPGLPDYELALPALADPDIRLEFFRNGSLRTVRLGVEDMSNQRGFIAGVANERLAVVSAPVLRSLGAGLNFSDNPELVSLDFPALEDTRFLTLPRNASLATLSLPALRSAQEVNLNSATGLANVSFPSLTTLGGLQIVGANSLETLDAFSSVTSGMVNVNVQNNASLLDYEGLRNIGDALSADPIFSGAINLFNPLICQDEAERFRDFMEAKYPGDMAALRVSIFGPACPPPPDSD